MLFPIPVTWCVLAHFGLLGFLENKLLDWRFRYRGEIDAPLKVVYVDVDSVSIDALGNFPWNRANYARVCSALLTAGHVKAIGIDFVMSDKGLSDFYDRTQLITGNLEFGRFLHAGPPVVLAASYSAADFLDINGRREIRELPLLFKGLPPEQALPEPEVPEFNIGRKAFWRPGTIGLIDTMDAGTRIVPAFTPTAVRPWPYRHMALELALLYWGLPEDAAKIFDNRIEITRPDGGRVATIPLQHGQLLEINWFSPWVSARNPRISFSAVYSYSQMLKSDNEDERKAAQAFFAQPDFRDAVVLIGPVDPLLQDLATTSFDDLPVPKVGVHGNLLKTIVSGKFLRHPPEWVADGLIFGLTLVMSTLVIAGGARGLRAKLVALLVLVAFVWTGFYLFDRAQIVLPMVAPLGAAFTTSFFAVGWQLIKEEKQKGRIKGMFGAYVSPEVVHRMIESDEEPKLGGVEENITAYFSDIQSFSTFSEKLGPAQLVHLMNEYLTACTDIVQAEGGTLDKYIGDAVVAIYGAPLALPDHAHRACVAALRVHDRVAELREKWKSEGGAWPEIVHNLQTRIGLNSGLCVVGNMGSHTRFNYTMMGDNVNLAARMESGAKGWGVHSMCTEMTKLACEQHGGDRVIFRPLGKIVVMGRAQPVPVFEIAGLKETLAQQTRECLGVFEGGLASYHARDWDGALAKFRQSASLEPNQPGRTPGVKTNPSLVYLEIVAQMKIAPPDEKWDGVYVMKEK